ncbi:hypothetical protein Plant_25 [Bacillus phage poppyseed]|uniref:Uncharacterized protein n=4 Tax=Pagevirus TaxID=1921184 RepID=A0A0A0RNM3_9CAUD|nr:hypothetical protein Page_25 [Bacillus phage Page]YP_008771343.1 hypothetical protein Pony_25 [Bacillus phage Pony]YP_009152824.1 hypothetical protein CPT_Pookie25 [Bacillus phage Pookie]YP_009197494.1 hypothetical protein AVT25_gp25 [Bacillus phage Pavlov]AGY48042.1 hypothetical protein Plant_25 [Bacillus phage poppyseed]AGY47947.1 hypothetical protein Page_25 [Bacillus phage Page]AGY48266.1 hypothetical protein Pony_25 [Bacillus phage Pony]AIW03710.1 hypothetical protein CPT_Pookie25 [B
MLTVGLGGLVFLGLAVAEKKGWIDGERVKTITTIGMSAGIGALLLYFIFSLKVFL